MENLGSKVAVVTGAARGMGFGISKSLAAKGAAVVMLGRNKNVLSSAELIKRKGGEAEGFVCDVTEDFAVNETIRKTVDRYRHIDILVNAAGIMELKAFTDPQIMTNLNRMMDVNFFGTWRMCHAVIPYMLIRKYGRIINISSVTGVRVCDPLYSSYASAKAAVAGLTKALAAEFANADITVNSLLPGTIHTAMIDAFAQEENKQDPDAVLAEISESIPLGRMGTADEVGEFVSLLVSDAAAYMTGTEIVFDGGSILPES